MRIDRLLWFLRLAASRGFAQQWVQAGHMRLNGRRIAKPGTMVAAGDILTLPMRSQVRIVRIVALPGRRGPAPEAQSCYQVLDEHAEMDLAADNRAAPEGNRLP